MPLTAVPKTCILPSKKTQISSSRSSVFMVGSAERRGLSNDVVQVLVKCPLVVDQRFGITNNIDEQDVTYLWRDGGCDLHGNWFVAL